MEKNKCIDVWQKHLKSGQQKRCISDTSLQGFTLVELIVVITILAILATIGFVSFSGYLAGTRDTNRVAQLKSMSDALELYRTKKDLPIPDDKVDIKAGTEVIAYQGYIGKNVLETIEYTESGLDPKDKQYFTYYLTKNKKYFQLMAFLEEPNEDEVAINKFSKSFAGDYVERIPKTTGKKLGILTDLENNPIQEVSEVTNSGYLDLSDTGTKEFKAIISDEEIVSGTGYILPSASLKLSCKRIKQIKGGSSDGIYTIDPEGNGIGFKVYCDMVNGGITDFLMGEGNFTKGKGISTESGSNTINDIVKIKSPIESGYGIHQTGLTTSEYEIHFPDVTVCKKGYILRMSLWDADNAENSLNIFHHRYRDTAGNVHYILNDSAPDPVIKVKLHEGKEWKLKQVEGPLIDDLTEFDWYIGYKSEDPKDLYFTGVRLSCLPR